jgi:hypothetical protein
LGDPPRHATTSPVHSVDDLSEDVMHRSLLWCPDNKILEQVVLKRSIQRTIEREQLIGSGDVFADVMEEVEQWLRSLASPEFASWFAWES